MGVGQCKNLLVVGTTRGGYAHVVHTKKGLCTKGKRALTNSIGHLEGLGGHFEGRGGGLVQFIHATNKQQTTYNALTHYQNNKTTTTTPTTTPTPTTTLYNNLPVPSIRFMSKTKFGNPVQH